MQQRLLDGDGDIEGDGAGALFRAGQTAVFHHQRAGRQSGVALEDAFVDVQKGADRPVAVGMRADPPFAPGARLDQRVRLPDQHPGEGVVAGVRDLSLMTLHFAIAGREHELACLRVPDIAEDPEGRGLIVDVRVSKVAPPHGRSAVRLTRPPLPGPRMASLEAGTGRGCRPGQLRLTDGGPCTTDGRPSS
ncbi:hypothetical protein ACWEP4_30120 [Streptomyces sp. NPDC004227]